MTQEKLGCLNDFAEGRGLEPQSDQAIEQYTSALTENYTRIRRVNGLLVQSCIRVDRVGEVIMEAQA